MSIRCWVLLTGEPDKGRKPVCSTAFHHQKSGFAELVWLLKFKENEMKEDIFTCTTCSSRISILLPRGVRASEVGCALTVNNTVGRRFDPIALQTLDALASNMFHAGVLAIFVGTLLVC